MTIRTVAKSLLLPLLFVAQSATAFDFNLEAEHRTVDQFSSLAVSGLAEVYLTKGNVGDIEVKVSGISMDDVITRTENGKLTVTTKGFHNGETVKVYVSYQMLNAISVSGASELYSKDTITADNLTINISGAGNAELNVDVNTLKVDMKGAGDLKIAGEADEQKIRSHNSRGSLDNSNLSYGE